MTIDMSREDLARTYEGTFIGLRDGVRIVPFRVTGSSRRNELQGTIDEENITRVDINSPDIVLSYPDSGAFNVGNKAVFVSRRPQRQYRRGIAERHLRIIGDARFDRKLVEAMFNPEWHGYQHVIDNCSKKSSYSGAVDRNFWIQKTPRFVNPVIMFRAAAVGEVKDGEVIIPDQSILKLFKEAIHENP